MWAVYYLPEAENERIQLPVRELNALDHAADKLEALGSQLPFPHQSAVRGAENLRELRPRGGRSPWRAFYRRIGNEFIIGSVGPEAQSDRLGFDRAVDFAVDRLNSYEKTR